MTPGSDAAPPKPDLWHLLCLPDQHGELDATWLDHVRERFPNAVLWARPTLASKHGLKQIALKGRDPLAWQSHFPDGVLVLRSGLQLPDCLRPRLSAHRRLSSAALVILPGNHHAALNPAAGLHFPEHIDWSGTGLDSLVAAAAPGIAQALRAPIGEAFMLTGHGAGVTLVDNIWIHDPSQPLNAGHFDTPAVRQALGSLRLQLMELLQSELPALPYFGLDGCPVTLHITHSWGGGIRQWVRDQCAVHSSGQHSLVLSSHGSDHPHEHGQTLQLFAAGPDAGRLATWPLIPAISSTAVAHNQYGECLNHLIHRYGVTQIMVSSLIGHSLNALRQPLPTGQVLHDVYPASPILGVDPLEHLGTNGEVDVDSALTASAEPCPFSQEDLAQWSSLSTAWRDTVSEHEVALIAPTEHVAERWLTLFDRRIPIPEVIAHGFDARWPSIPDGIPAQARTDGKLNLVVIGRISGGKGADWLYQRASAITQHAHLTLLGAGQSGLAFFGHSNIDVVLDYNQDDLPQLLNEIKPQAALFLSTVPETWNYVLSEVRALGLTPIAPNMGSFAERITHGSDGLLYALNDDSLIELLAAAQNDSGILPVTTSLKEPSVAQSHARYQQLIQSLTPKQCNPTEPSTANDGQGTRHSDLAAQLADLQLSHASLSNKASHLEHDLSARTDWALRMERLAQARTKWAITLDTQLKETFEWGQALDLKLKETIEWGQGLEAEIRALEDQRDALTQARDLVQLQRDQLQDEITMMLTSRSWRLTKPLRFIARVVRTAKYRRVYKPLRWPGVIARLIHRVRLYGLGPTLDSLQYGGPHSDSAPAQIPHEPAPSEVQTPPDAPKPSDEPVIPTAPGQPSSIKWNTQDGKPDASVVIPVFNNVEYTSACLNSLVEHAGQRSAEIIVVDDCSDQDTVGYLAACSGITVIRNEQNSGFIASCNRGAAAASADILVFLNNDTTVTSGWLDALLGTFEVFPEAGAVGAKLIYPDGQLQEAGGIIFSDASGWNYGRLDDPQKPAFNFASAADYVSGACIAVPRSLFEQLGGFDDYYSPAYYEDTDLCFKLEDAGYSVIMQPTSVIVHHEGISSGTSETSGIKRYQAINRDKFRERWQARLSTQPEPVAGPQDIEAVDQARFKRFIGHALVIDATLPEPDQDSGSVRMVAMLDLLRELGYRVTFVAANLSWSDRYSTALQRRGIEVLYHPIITSVDQFLLDNGHHLDLVIVSRHYILDPVLKTIRETCPGAKLIFDTVDLHYLREQRKADLEDSAEMARLAGQTKSVELRLINDSDITLVVSEVERTILAEEAPNADVRILSNIYEPQPEGPNWASRHGVMFVGGFQHPPNVDAAHWLIDEIVPGLVEQLPDLIVHIIGSRMPDSIKQARRPGLQVHGYVEDLSLFLRSCRVSVAPLRYGAGVKGKVNQAMAHGLPVVATTCAAEGLHTTPERDLLIADTTQAFINQVVRLHSNAELWHTLADNGRANIAKYFSREAARQQLESILK